MTLDRAAIARWTAANLRARAEHYAVPTEFSKPIYCTDRTRLRPPQRTRCWPCRRARGKGAA